MNITCISDYGYFDSPDFLSLSMHIVTVVSVPVHAIGLYCILFKTPNEMKSVKPYLLVLHTWIILFDYSLGLFVMPFVLFPAAAGYTLGVLSYFGVPTIFQASLVLNVLGNMCISIISVFENRFHTICTFPKMEYWTFWRRPWLAAHYILYFLGQVRVAYLVPEQTQDMIFRVFQYVPCLPPLIYQAPIFVVVEVNFSFHMIFATLFVFIFASEVTFFAVFMVKYLHGQLKNRKISQKTFKIQRAFFMALAIQLILPLAVFMIPISFVMITILFYYYNQAVTNMIIVSFAAHGFISTSIMIMVHRPYRDTVLSWIRKKKVDCRQISIVSTFVAKIDINAESELANPRIPPKMNITCISDYGYFDSPDFLSLAMHIVTVISAPIHVIGLYCILFKTPIEMKSVKPYLLVLHTWIILWDYSLGLLTIPFVFLPPASGFPLGILKYTGIPVGIQTFVVLNIMGYMCISIISVFESRFFIVCGFHEGNYWTYWRRPWLAAHYFLFFGLLVRVAQLVPEQTQELVHTVFRWVSCLPSYLYEAPIYVVVITDYYFHMISVTIFFAVFVSEVTFFSGFMVKYLSGQLRDQKISRNSFKIQRNFFMALAIQMMIPLALFVAPVSYILVSIVYNYYNQAAVNFIMTFFATHGFVATIIMVSVHRPYRDTVLSWISKRRPGTRQDSVGPSLFTTV